MTTARPTLTMSTEEEAWLIGQSRGPGQCIQTNLGPGPARLEDTSANVWAYDLLLDRRYQAEIPDSAIYMVRQEAR